MDKSEDSQLTTNLEASEQVAAPAIANYPTVRVAAGGLKTFAPSEALNEIETAGVRGNSAMILLKSLVRTLEVQLHGSEQRYSSLEARFAILQKQDQEKGELVAVLKCELKNTVKLKLAQNVLLTAGGILNGIGVKYQIDGREGMVWLVSGVVLLFAGWLWPFGPKSK